MGNTKKKGITNHSRTGGEGVKNREGPGEKVRSRKGVGVILNSANTHPGKEARHRGRAHIEQKGSRR